MAASVGGSEETAIAAARELRYAQEALAAAGGADADARVARVLDGLGFTKADWHAGCDTLSGGCVRPPSAATAFLARWPR